MAEVFVVVLVLLSIVVENVFANVVRVVLVTAVRVVVGTSVVVFVVVAAVLVFVVLAVVTGGAIASCSSCGCHCKPLHTAPHNTNTATAADSHRIGKYLGVGTTCFSPSTVIQRAQNRALCRNSAPQCGQCFNFVYPKVSKSLSKRISLIWMTDNRLQMP